MRSIASASAATGASWRSTATRTASTWSIAKSALGRRQILPPRPLERRANRRGARLRAGARRPRDPGDRTARARRRHASSRRRAALRACIRSTAAAPPSSTTATRSTWLGRFIGRIHAIGAQRGFEHRPALDIASFGDEPREFLLANGFVPDDLREAYGSVSAMALAGVRRCYERSGNVRPLRLHGDCHASNVLWTQDGPHFVDFDDARTGPAMQDLWMLLSGDRAAMTRQLADVLAGYEDFAELDRRELHLVEALRTLRLLHYSAWIARRWDDPAFPAAFPVVQHAALLAGPHPRAARADRGDGRAAARGLTSRLVQREHLLRARNTLQRVAAETHQARTCPPAASANACDTITCCSSEPHSASIRAASLTAGPSTVKSSRRGLPTLPYRSSPT